LVYPKNIYSVFVGEKYVRGLILF